MAQFMRRKILDISFQSSHAAHLGGGLSMVEIMATLYAHILNFDKNKPNWEKRDRFILSKGHGVLGYFSALLAVGFISEEKYATYLKNESDLIAHPIMNLDLGIESSNGSLGQGLSMGIGIAYSAKKNKNLEYKAYVLLGDGECNEGSVWEAALFASAKNLNNLCAFVDYNKWQATGKSQEVLKLGSLAKKFEQFGWNVLEIDGHNHDLIYKACKVAIKEKSKPTMIIANTIKGKGISFMEDDNNWHYRIPSDKEVKLAKKELKI